MFLLEEKKRYTKKVCPNGHDLKTITSGRDDTVKYCFDCGAELIIETVPYSIQRVDDMTKRVDNMTKGLAVEATAVLFALFERVILYLRKK